MLTDRGSGRGARFDPTVADALPPPTKLSPGARPPTGSREQARLRNDSRHHRKICRRRTGLRDVKFKPRHRVHFYDMRGDTHRAVVTAATPDWVRIRLWDGREILLDDREGVSRLTLAPYRRR